MKIPFVYIVRSLIRRLRSTTLTLSAFGLVVFSLLMLLSMVEGVNDMLISSGAPDRVIAFNANVTSENHSQLSPRDVRAVGDHEAVKLTAEGVPYASAEVVKTAYAISPRGDRVQANFRGVDLRQAQLVHNRLRLIAGRFFNPDVEDEVILGRKVRDAMGTTLGDRFEAQRASWRVVGVFEDGGSMVESEIWTSAGNVILAYNKSSVSSVWIRVNDPDQTARVVRQLNDDARLSVYATTEKDLYAQGFAAARGLQALAWVVAVIMAIGAVFSAMNTIFASVADRAGELAAMRAIGFQGRSVRMSLMIEAQVIAFSGGLLACLMGWALDGVTVRTLLPGMGVIGFQFKVSFQLLGIAAAFSLVLGLLGGWFPARHAVRRNIVQALNS